MHARPDYSAALSGLSGRYDVEHEIGAGGMATVYLARDVKHDRQVALKVLNPELGAVLGVERFLSEIRVTANLQHPNILPLFDSGESEGLLFYVMPYVPGESLRVRMDREKRLPVGDAVRIATAVASALDYAHRHGVVHRDVKPENVLLSDGVPVVADFGIAKAVSSSRLDTAAGQPAITQIGVAVGTPSYMSPEQAMGDSTVDGRSDVYALGCLLYEMLIGDLPFTGPTAQAIIAKHIMTPPPSARSLRDTVPPVVDAAITRAMSKEPGDRFPTPADFAAALSAAPPVEPLPDYSRVAEPVTRSQAPMAGRRRELGDLTARLDALSEGHGGLVLIGGEPGVGKTRLTEAVLLEARRRGHFCAVGHCYEMEGAPPYLPFVEHLEYISRVVPPGRFRASLGSAAAEIARIMPALRQLFPDIPDALDLPPDQQRHFLFTRMRDFMERSCATVPIVLLFDDLHWADDSTLMLLEHLAQYLGQMRILALGTYRDVELEVGRPFAKTIERLTRHRLADRITLRRMPEADVAEMLAILGAPEPPPLLVSAIYRETEGNPFFVEEVFHHLKEEGRVLDAEGLWLADIRIDELDVPEGVRLVIGRRLERAGDDCRAVLTAAAVIGPRFDQKILESLEEMDGDKILDALERAESAGLILSRAVGRVTRYTFAHELIRQTLLATLSMPRRQRRHQRTADAIERAYASKIDAHVSDLAYHLFQAGAAVDVERTTRYLLLAGQLALTAGAFDESLAQVDKALSIIETAGDRRHADLLRVRAEALRGLGRWDEGVREFDAALVLFERLGAEDEVVAVVLTVADVLLWSLADHGRLTEMTRRALAMVGDVPSVARARLLSRGGISAGFSHDYGDGLSMIEESLRMARALGDEPLYAESLGLRGGLLFNFACTDAAILDLAEAYRNAVDSGKRWQAARFGSLLARSYLLRGQLDLALALDDEVGATASEIGHVGAANITNLDRGIIDWMRAPDLNALERFAQRAADDPASVRTFREAAKSLVAQVRQERGVDPDPGAIIRGDDPRPGFESWRDTHVAWRGVAWATYFLHSAYSHPTRATELFERHAHLLPVAGRPSYGGAWWGLDRVVQGLVVLGERARAAALYPECVDLLRLGNRVGDDGVYECAAAIASASGQEWALSEAHFVNALRTANETPHVPAQAEIRRWHAWMLSLRRTSGDVERANTMLDEAIAINQRIGLPRRVRLCEELRLTLTATTE